MKKLTMILALTLAVAACGLAKVPKEWVERYHALGKIMEAKNLKGFYASFTEDFVTIDSKGKSTDRKGFFELVTGLMKNAKTVKAVETLKSVTVTREHVAVSFDFTLTLHNMDKSTTKVHEIGTDFWRKDGGKWKMFKTVDRSFELTTSKPK